MGALDGAMRAVANTCQHYVGSAGAITITPVGGSPVAADAIVYRERSSLRRTGTGEREKMWTRRVVLPPGSDAVHPDATFEVDGVVYRIDSVDRKRGNKSQVIEGVRYAATTKSRNQYYRR